MATQPTLHLGTGLTLPLEAVTQTFAILAKRGMGKTYTASVLVEEMLEHQQRVVVIDPIGVGGRGPCRPRIRPMTDRAPTINDHHQEQ